MAAAFYVAIRRRKQRSREILSHHILRQRRPRNPELALLRALARAQEKESST